MSESPATRLSLLARIRDVRDGTAWGEFVELYAPLVYRLARKKGLQDADAADVTQDVLRTVVARADRFRYDPERGSFRGWLFTVAYNRLRKFANARRRQGQGRGDTGREVLDVQPARAEESALWEQEYRDRLLAWAAERVRAGFRESTWQAFWGTAVEGREPREVAVGLGISVGAVYIAKNRVLARIREVIHQWRGG
jgi:RNA polymerase sigma-70 factor (ECF subfamily)